MRTVAALYVEKGGPYFTMPDVDTWDVARDARTYAGPHPVVAHPPCGPWGRLRHLYRGDEHDCAPAAVVAVRTWGGVLECAWGHVARKTSWLYIVGVTHDEVIAGVRTGGTPTHWISGFRTARGAAPKRYRSNGSAVPPGIKVCSAQQRRRTPPLFAAWLVDLARSAHPRSRAA